MRAFSVGLAALMAGCGGAAPVAAPAPAAEVIGWALGSEHRTPRPPTADAMLLLAPVGQKPATGSRVTGGCVESASFLPAPRGDPRIFFVVKGALYVRSAPGQVPLPLAGNDPALSIKRLLAFKAAASPLEVLVGARAEGATGEEIWAVSVDERSIQRAARAGFERAFTSQAAFFQAYSSPRCLSGGRQCLMLDADGQLDVEPVRGKAPVPLEELGDINVRDVAWASGEGEAIYFLVDCPPT